jgi:hypothetical protein
MKKNLMTCVAVASLALGVVALQGPARADSRGAVAAGIIGGVAVGAMIGAAAANNNAPYYPSSAAYYGPGSPGCYWQRQRYWDGFMWRWTRVRVCY